MKVSVRSVHPLLGNALHDALAHTDQTRIQRTPHTKYLARIVP